MTNEEINELINNFYPYFKIMDNINLCLKDIINNNISRNNYYIEEKFYNITSEMLRLIPYKVNNNEIVIDKYSGILLIDYMDNLFIEYYTKILFFPFYKNIFKDILKIRNKFIHEPHNLSCGYYVGGKNSCSIGLYYKDTLLNISSITLAPIVYYLNDLFDYIKNKLVNKIIINIDIIGEREKMFFNEIYQMNFDNKYYHFTVLPEYFITDLQFKKLLK